MRNYQPIKKGSAARCSATPLNGDLQYGVHTSVTIFIIFEFKHFSRKTAVSGDHDDLLLDSEIITVLQQHNSRGQGPIAL